MPGVFLLQMFFLRLRVHWWIEVLAGCDNCLLLASLRGVAFCLDAKSDQKDQGIEIISAPAEKLFGGSGRLAAHKQVPELFPQIAFLL